jgi:hypothetical protein
MKVKAKEEFKVKDSEVLYSVMAAAISNSLACKYNFRGDGNQKRPFCKLLLWEVIIGEYIFLYKFCVFYNSRKILSPQILLICV